MPEFNYFAIETKTLIKSSNRWVTVHLFEDSERRDEWVARKAEPKRDPATTMTTCRQAITEEQAAAEIGKMNKRSAFEGGIVKHTYMQPSAPKERRERKAAARDPNAEDLPHTPVQMKKIGHDSVFGRFPFLKSNFDPSGTSDIDPDLLMANSRYVVSWRCDECGKEFRRSVRAQAARARKGSDTQGHISCSSCAGKATVAAKKASAGLS